MAPFDRRRFLRSLAGVAAFTVTDGAGRAFAAAAPRPDYRRLLVLVELKGGNDGLNTLVPFADPEYYRLRPKLAIAREQALALDDACGLHPSLEPLLPLWRASQLAVVRGVGYPVPNLSHFRSIEIWDTASASDQYLQDGWLTRTFAAAPVPRSYAADGVVVGSNDLGPLAGDGTRAIALADTDQFVRQSRLAADSGQSSRRALAHILKVEADIRQAALNLDAKTVFRTEFPRGDFGNAVRAACQVISNRAGIAVARITLGGFDTHQNQAPTQARLLGELAAGLAALKDALTEIGRWDDTLVLTYAEFGRRPQENMSGGTDHGTSSVHFALGGRVVGGLYGAQPPLARLDGAGNPAFDIDFRSVYATVLERWWNVASATPLQGRFAPLDFLRA